MYEEEDESRELISTDEEEEGMYFYQYCFCTKMLVESRECRCRYCVVGGCSFPFLIVADALAFVPQLIINNIKLCLR